MAETSRNSALISLLFVSQVSILSCDLTRELDNILSVAKSRNTMSDITGVLIVSPQYFALLLEGPIGNVEAVIASVRIDPRHLGMRIVATAPIAMASYVRWQMIRFIETNFASAIVDPLLEAAYVGDDPQAVARLQRFIEAISSASRQSDMPYLAPAWICKDDPNICG